MDTLKNTLVKFYKLTILEILLPLAALGLYFIIESDSTNVDFITLLALAFLIFALFVADIIYKIFNLDRHFEEIEHIKNEGRRRDKFLLVANFIVLLISFISFSWKSATILISMLWV